MSTVLSRLLELQSQINALIEEVKGAPNAPKKVRKVKVVPMDDKNAAKDAGIDAANAIEEEKPKKVLSPEHLEKLKAGREVAKARKAAEKAAEEAALEAAKQKTE
jgi:hypothetical protein